MLFVFYSSCRTASAQTDESVKAYTKEDAEKFFEIGQSYHRGRNYTLAIDNFSRAIQIDPEYLLAYICRGDTYYGLQRYSEAIQDFTCVIQLGFGDAFELGTAYCLRGASYNGIGDYEQAVVDLTEAIELLRFVPLPYYCRNHSYYMLGKLPEAYDDITIAINLDPLGQNSYAFYRDRGNIYIMNGKTTPKLLKIMNCRQD